ncbi:hypothetical protein OUZ56_031529 [Daphnia magna]|uniref:Uncharacterized protein n=1 Tax=Daphnia magna TaxID=35525 RepID=A0ABQ9ZVL0_9CRUS|nr:hypothetical protein OUZ56_031529 [Daphnia magna]
MQDQSVLSFRPQQSLLFWLSGGGRCGPRPRESGVDLGHSNYVRGMHIEEPLEGKECPCLERAPCVCVNNHEVLVVQLTSRRFGSLIHDDIRCMRHRIRGEKEGLIWQSADRRGIFPAANNTPQDKEQGLPFYPFKEDKKLLAKSYDG